MGLQSELDTAEGAGNEPSRDAADSFTGSRPFIRIALALFAAQFIGLMAYSWVQYQRFTLGIDFASVNQAATEISHGNLNPYSTVLIPSSSFLDNHFALILWPIAAIMVVIRTPFVLLVVQNAFLAATGFVTFAWASDLVASRAIRREFAYGILGVGGLLLLLDPLVYYSAALDFHFEAIATFAAVFAAYDIWSGRTRRAWIWVGLCFLCGDIGGLYIAGVGISALLAGKATRRMGGLSVVAGVIWVGFITAIHANQGSLLDNYAYLANRQTLPTGYKGGVVVLGGLAAHPLRAWDQLHPKLRMIWRYLPPGGVIGIITPWGIGVPLIVLLSSALQSNTLFIGEPFQQFPVVPFLLIGTVSLLSALVANKARLSLLAGRTWALRWTAARTARWVVAGVLLFGIFVGGIRYAHEYLSDSFTDNAAGVIITAPQASAFGTVLSRTPSNAEVISSIDISGRFSGRRYAYVYLDNTFSIPIRAHSVELVMDELHDPYVTAAQRQAAYRFLVTRFHARTILHRNGVWAIGWTAPSTNVSITLP